MVACSFIYIPAEPVFTAGSQQQLAQVGAPANIVSTSQTPVAQHQPTCDGPSLTHSPASDSTEDGPVSKIGTCSES